MNFLTSPEFLFSAGVAVLIGGGLYWKQHKAKDTSGSDASSKQGLQLLSQYAIDYTERARKGDLQPVIGRH